jgi:hypothetical protein
MLGRALVSSKFCIFCGKPPSDKNKEHVLPRWLLSLTGDPKRIARFGFSTRHGEEPKERQYAFDQFTFPACEQCNTRHAALESAAKAVLEKVLNTEPVCPSEMSVLLNWFDKVRVGLWLGFHQLSKNEFDVDPQYYIERRIGQFDRLLIVERYTPPTRQLNMFGVDTPAFGLTPSAFALTVNGFHFTNVSTIFLVSRRLGFPYPSESHLVTDRAGLMHTIQPGRQRIMQPVLQRPVKERGVILYQPMFPQDLAEKPVDFYDDSYVRANSLDYDAGIGALFIERSKSAVRRLGNDEQVVLDPTPGFGLEELQIRSAINTCDWQDWLTEGSFGFGNLTPEQRRYVRARQNMAKRVNKILREHHSRLLREGGYT